MIEQSEQKQERDYLHEFLSETRNTTTSSAPHDNDHQSIRTNLEQIRQRLIKHLSLDPRRSPLGGIGVFHCRRPQEVRNVPIHQPLVVLVVSGHKTIILGERSLTVSPGELLLLPGGCTVAIGNHPGPRGEPYLGLAMGFPEQVIQQFQRSYGTEAAAETQPYWKAPAPWDMIAAMGQWVDWCLRHPIDDTLIHHRQVEVLLLLARTGIAGNLLIDREASWRERVAQLIALDPARDWSAGQVCRRLGIGESTLRRHLKADGSGFRQVLEECRMVAALALLQETFWPVSQIAEAVGYHSHSRFSERFKRRFGLSPTELKRSRSSEAEQPMSD
jgi:AraC-like DNA-binding protein